MMSSIKIVITGAVSIVIQFGLAITAWGGWHAFFAHPAFRALAWVTGGLAALAVFSGGGMSSGEQEDRGNRWVLGAFGVIALLRWRITQCVVRRDTGSNARSPASDILLRLDLPGTTEGLLTPGPGERPVMAF